MNNLRNGDLQASRNSKCGLGMKIFTNPGIEFVGVECCGEELLSERLGHSGLEVLCLYIIFVKLDSPSPPPIDIPS